MQSTQVVAEFDLKCNYVWQYSCLDLLMDVLALTRQYESLSDDELVRVWADEDGLTDIARSILSNELTKRGLSSDPGACARKGELAKELLENKRRLERHQKRVMWKSLAWVAVIVISVLYAVAKVFFK
jgi:hypothetical protein